ncbi:MAG: ferredoxin [Sutterellaceae bacterium]|uniref:2Fe-2S iron-sulfur cluster-binding protein n=1 Tax=Limnobacter sp. UBA7229 TaxID=1946762 RepID=UPI000C599000|nr:2Fe-2S iron-sulfur cluster-binding protein [Limnobacter sp. UBA7229]MAG81382.1 ferredoxin [Sutterellaceae bacterium]MBT83863.1 ferredoxin [Sutterellaceae bacterium]|tara:strand:+ start:54 stop:377 length:324 start_codon:yes stop_codon:yes gene_type:complete
MPIAVYVCPNGDVKEVEIAEGHNLMQAAVANGIYDIVGDCGGSASCATCHVYLDTDYVSKVAPPSDRELEMLEGVSAERRENSRLSCQLTMQDGLAGIRVVIADTQW